MLISERILKIIDEFEGGSKSKFGEKTGLGSHVYNITKPNAAVGKRVQDKIVAAYSSLSAKWLESEIGDMLKRETTEPADTTNHQAKKIIFAGMPDQMPPKEVLDYVLRYSGQGTLAKLAVKLNLRLKVLNAINTENKKIGSSLARAIHKVYPELPYNWLMTGVVKRDQGNKRKPAKQTTIAIIKADRPIESDKQEIPENTQIVKDQFYVQTLESQIQILLKTQNKLLSDYAKVVDINQELLNKILGLMKNLTNYHL